MSQPNPLQLAISARTRKSAYYSGTVAAGVSGFTIYNHMLLPTRFEGLEQDYSHLINNVTLWDVAAERQVEIKGPDAFHLVRLMTPRNLQKWKVGVCKYVPIVDNKGGLVNDPVALRVEEDTFWLSLADSDVELYAKGLAIGLNLDVEIDEPDVSPLAVQGPNADAVMTKVFGDWVKNIRFFRFKPFELDGMSMLIARSGWSKQGGYEIYLKDSMQHGTRLWDLMMDAGAEFDMKPAAPNLIERIESALLSFGNDMTNDHSPFEAGLDQYCDLDQEFDFIGKAALKRIRDEGIKQKITGLVIEGGQLTPNTVHWPVKADDGAQIGAISSSVYSPRLEKNIAIAMVDINYLEPGTQVSILTDWGEMRYAKVAALPFV